MTNRSQRVAKAIKRDAIGLLRRAAEVEGDLHFDNHLIELTNNGFTVQHPIVERIDGSLFDCPYTHWDAGDIGYRGRYVLHMDEDGQLNIGDNVTPWSEDPTP